jgi:hypothetical protein
MTKPLQVPSISLLISYSLPLSLCSVFATISVNALTGSIFYLLFEFFHARHPNLFYSKCHHLPSSTPPPPALPTLSSSPKEGLQRLLPPGTSTLFYWFLTPLSLSDHDLLSFIGMDAYVLLKYLKLCAKFCIFCSFFNLLILCPVYFTSYGHQLGIAGINLYTMGNIPPGGNRLWASCLFCWLYNLYFLSLMHSEYHHFVQLRQSYFYAAGRKEIVHQQSESQKEKHGDESSSPSLVFAPASQQHYSVMIENIPFYYRTPHRLEQLMNEWFPNQIYSAVIACNLQELQELAEKREKDIEQLEIAIAYHHATKHKKRKIVYLSPDHTQQQARQENDQGQQQRQVVVWCNLCGFASPCDAIDFYSQKVDQSNRQIQQLQSQILRKDEALVQQDQREDLEGEKSQHLAVSHFINPLLMSSRQEKENPSTGVTEVVTGERGQEEQEEGSGGGEPLPSEDFNASPDVELLPQEFGYRSGTGFVTFLNRQTQVQSSQIHVLSDIYSDIFISPAPSTEDIIWENLTATAQQQQHGQHLTSMIFSGGMLFWGSVLAFIAAISNLSNLQKYLPFIKNLDPVLYSLLAGILPVIVMNLFLSLLPAIFGYGATKFEKRKTKSGVQYEVFRWYFGYQLANVYLILLAGSLFTALADALENPSSIIRLLAAALPSVSVFFINYLLTEILTSAPGELLQLIPLAIWYVYKFLLPEPYLTKRQLFNGPLQPAEFDYGSTLPSFLFILCIVLTYMTIAPVMTVLGAIYFVLFYVILKYKFLFVFLPSFETGGSFWYGLYDFSMQGLLVSSITMVGYMAVKEGIAQAPFVLPIPFVILRAWAHTSKSFERVSRDMAYSRAVQADKEEQGREGGVSTASFDKRYYAAPCLTEHWEAVPEPYRINGKPLLNKRGVLDEVYHEREGGGQEEEGGEGDVEQGGERDLSGEENEGMEIPKQKQ